MERLKVALLIALWLAAGIFLTWVIGSDSGPCTKKSERGSRQQ
jgi:hypothetical protein